MFKKRRGPTRGRVLGAVFGSLFLHALRRNIPLETPPAKTTHKKRAGTLKVSAKTSYIKQPKRKPNTNRLIREKGNRFFACSRMRRCRQLGRSSSQNARGTLPRRAVLFPLAGTEAGFYQSLAAHAADLAGGHCCKCWFEGREAEISILAEGQWMGKGGLLTSV